MKTPARFLVVLSVLATVSFVPCTAQDTWEDVMPGVRHLHRITPVPWDIHVLVIDLTNPHVRLRTVIKNDNDLSDGGETVRSMCQRYNAVAGINTDYWGGSPVSHCPQGHTMTDGLTMLPPGMTSPIVPDRTTMTIPADNAYVLIGKVTSPLPWWFNVAAGGPRIIRNGVVGWEQEVDIPDQTSRQPRTGAAVSQDWHTLIFATCDGRQADSAGMTANEMGYLLQEFGGYNGMSFDGGGSTTMVVNGSTVNHPSDGYDRSVAGGLIVIDRFAQPSNPVVHYETGFEYPPFVVGSVAAVDGWTGNGAQIVSTGTTANNALRVVDGYAARSLVTPPQTGCQWIEIKMKTNSVSGGGSLAVGSAANGADAAVVRFGSSGSIEYLEGNRVGGGTYRNVKTYSANTWYKIGLRLDYRINSYQLFVDSKLLASGVWFKDSGASSGLAYIRFEEAAGVTGELLVDDLYAGTVDPVFPRVYPNTLRLPVGAKKQMELRSASGTPSFELVDQKNQSGNPAVVASISSTGELTALGPGICKVKSADGTGKTDYSSVITLAPDLSLGNIRSAPDGTLVDLSGVIVTASFGNSFFVEESDRSSALKVSLPYSGYVQPGDEVAVNGKVKTVSGERIIESSAVIKLRSGLPLPKPVGINNSRASSASLTGATSSAMLIRTSGKIVSIESGRFFINDGSVNDSGSLGLPIVCSSMPALIVGEHAVVTGVVSNTDVNSQTVGAVWAYPDDVRTLE